MYIKVSFTIKNSMDITQIDKNLKEMVDSGKTDNGVARKVRDEFSDIISRLSMGVDANGKQIEANVTDVEVWANDNDGSLVSSWHSES